MKTKNIEIESAIKSFKGRLNALRDFIILVEPHLNKSLKEAYKANGKSLIPVILLMNRQEPNAFPIPDNIIAKMAAVFGSKIEFNETEVSGKKEVVMKLDSNISQRVCEAVKQVERSREHQLQLYESSLVSLVSSIEVFFASLMHVHFALSGSVPSGKDRVFSYEDLKGIGTIQEAKELLIEGKIEDILRGPFRSWISFLRESMGLSMSYLDENIDILAEACLRRNLVVHNSSVVNKIYINKAPEMHRSKCNIGERIIVDKNYLSDVLNAFELNCLLIGLEYWKKLDAEAKNRGELVAEYSFSALTACRYSLCEGLSFFLLNDKKQSDDLITLGQLNYWLSMKKQDKWEAVRTSYEAADYSAKSLRFRVGLAALGTNDKAFFALAGQAKKAQDIEINEFLRFPIFDTYRTDLRFKSLCGSNRKTKQKSKLKKKKQINYNRQDASKRQKRHRKHEDR